ncbi:MAG: hypothetical protein KY476_21960, partial [Planctomycetes bacterium]|nr:hypothetical protein [Planctomycetota bacterium]
ELRDPPHKPRKLHMTALATIAPGAFSREFNKASVASLSHGHIARMPREQLVEALRAADLPLLDEEALGRLPKLERSTLERLLFLARRCCRNQGY